MTGESSIKLQCWEWVSHHLIHHASILPCCMWHWTDQQCHSGYLVALQNHHRARSWQRGEWAGDHPSPPPSYRSRIFSGPPEIAIAILWQTAVRIMLLATWQYCRLKHRLQATFSWMGISVVGIVCRAVCWSIWPDCVPMVGTGAKKLAIASASSPSFLWIKHIGVEVDRTNGR